MTKRMLLALVGLIMVLVSARAMIVSNLGFASARQIRWVSTLFGWNDECDSSPSIRSTIIAPSHAVTTHENATISVMLFNDTAILCTHELTLSSGSAHVTVAPSVTQYVAVNPRETKTVSWTLSTPYPSYQRVTVRNSAEEDVTMYVALRFIPAYYGLTGEQMSFILNAILLLGIALIVPLLRSFLVIAKQNRDILLDYASESTNNILER